MSEFILAGGAAFSFGIFTSISPCLLATNVTAISFLARRVDSVKFVLISCLCYIVGQAAAFVLLAMSLVTSLLTVTVVSHLLQKYMFRLLGPILLIGALFLLELVSVQLGSGRMKAWAQKYANAGGFWVAALLGIVFAMSFCPTTAWWFFGSLLPLSLQHESRFLLPFLYSLGVALPVMLFSLIVAFAANRLGTIYAQVGKAGDRARYVTGGIFLIVGLIFTVRYTFRLF